ncbi:MAG: nucleoside phosphorylase [Bacteroidales bacterium]|jgi:uridine phosphorylase|nr:nucleoside phosphorylase [Bacteroidales bacterium]
MTNKIKPSELPLQNTGAIYHLNLHPEELSSKVILVGDPGRVEMISAKFDTISVKKQNRELATHTGIYKEKPISVISTGMGPDNMDIVVNELDALANVNLKTMEINDAHKTLTLVRIGTCGILQKDIPVHSFIVSEFGFGLDGLLNFYSAHGISQEEVVGAFMDHTAWNDALPRPYCVAADRELLNTIGKEMVHGITATAPGFFGPQGRQVRATLQYPDLNEKIESFLFGHSKITNLEMECSALYGLSAILGHKALTCCVGIANRVSGDFSSNYHDAMNQLIEIVLDKI